MHIDSALLRIIKHRDQFERVCGYIPKSHTINKRTRAIVNDIGKYFQMHPDMELIDMEVFRSLFFTKWHPKLKEDDVGYYNQVLTRMEKDATERETRSIINHLVEAELATEIANIALAYDQSEDIDIMESVSGKLEQAMQKLQHDDMLEYADIEDDAIDEDDQHGLPWMLTCMREVYRPMQGADFYILAGRPGKGKTSFLTHLISYVVTFLEETKSIIWFNNESKKQRIMQRLIMSTLGMSLTKLRTMSGEERTTAYLKKMKRKDRVQIYDVHDKTNVDILKMLEGIGHENVGMIVFDMLDNVMYPAGKDLSDHKAVEELYQWGRSLAAKINVPIIATSQISTEGSGLLYPLEGMLKESKTAKQGACDGIIMIGCADDPMAPNERGISMPKTKTKLAEAHHLREVVNFNEDIGRYED